MSTSQKPSTTPIAIVGMSCLFPQAKDLSQYWDNIVHEIDCITDVPPSHWKTEDYYDPDPKVPDKTYSKRGGFIPDIDFDPTEFGLPPNILEITDASQLLSLVAAKAALKDAGYGDGNRTYNRDRTGVILGVGGGQNLISPLASRLQEPIWRRALQNSGVADADVDNIVQQIKAAYVPWEEDSFPGLLGNVIAGRVASRLDLGGTNCVVDAACAASLSAAKMAVSDLLEHRSDMIITGGVDTDNSIFMYMCFSKTPALTPHSHARPFDADSNGILIGEGVGMLILKRLEDAERDKDRIYAVIKGIGTSSDGRSKSIYAPREDGQVKALKRAYEDANIDVKTVGLIESHGTGTKAGDVCEVEALKEVFATGAKQQIALGSVKSQIGHTKSAAGAAGLIKTALSLHHKVLPPTLHIETPNPKLDLENSPLYLNTQTRPWFRPADQNMRRAGVSAFGFGGTNFHFVLEEYKKTQTDHPLHNIAKTILLYADTLPNLIDKCETARANLETEEKTQAFHDLVEASKSIEIPTSAHRVGFVADSMTQAIALFDTTIDGLKSLKDEAAWEHRKGVFYRHGALNENAKVVALFPGQGSQYVNMGRELAINVPLVRETWEMINDQFDTPLTDIAFPVPVFTDEAKKNQIQTLQKTENAQPSIGAFSAALYKLLQSAGFQPDFVAGHSFGELTALWAAGVLNDTDFFTLAKKRGEAMAPIDTPDFDPGTMLAVKASSDDIRPLFERIPDLTLANDNADKQVVLAGPLDSIQKAQQMLDIQNTSNVLLPVSGAFHTPLVAHAQRPFSEALKDVTFHRPQCPVYSNTTAEPLAMHPQTLRKTVGEHLIHPVRFREEIKKIYNDGGFVFVEIGPRNILTKLVKQILKDKPHLCVALNPTADGDSDRSFRQALLQLRVAGLPLRDITPSASQAETSQRKSKMNVRLNGNNYVSDKTKKEFEKALQDGHRNQTTQTTTPVTTTPESIPSPKQQTHNLQPQNHIKNNTQSSSHDFSKGQPMSPASQSPELRQQMIESLDRSLSQFYNLQAETLRVHEQYLQGQMEYARTFFQLIQQQYAMLGATPMPQTNNQPLQQPTTPPPLAMVQQPLAPPPITPAPQQTVAFMPPPVTQPSQSPNIPAAHTNGAGSHIETQIHHPQQPTASPSPQPTEQPVPPTPSAPISTPPTGGLDAEALTQSMLTIVSEKTGYPEDVIELDMDIEADLGIDSIKRVEILGAMLETHPELPSVNPEDLSELQTLAQIVGHMKQASVG